MTAPLSSQPIERELLVYLTPTERDIALRVQSGRDIANGSPSSKDEATYAPSTITRVLGSLWRKGVVTERGSTGMARQYLPAEVTLLGRKVLASKPISRGAGARHVWRGDRCLRCGLQKEPYDPRRNGAAGMNRYTSESGQHQGRAGKCRGAPPPQLAQGDDHE